MHLILGAAGGVLEQIQQLPVHPCLASGFLASVERQQEVLVGLKLRYLPVPPGPDWRTLPSVSPAHHRAASLLFNRSDLKLRNVFYFEIAYFIALFIFFMFFVLCCVIDVSVVYLNMLSCCFRCVWLFCLLPLLFFVSYKHDPWFPLHLLGMDPSPPHPTHHEPQS